MVDSNYNLFSLGYFGNFFGGSNANPKKELSRDDTKSLGDKTPTGLQTPPNIKSNDVSHRGSISLSTNQPYEAIDEKIIYKEKDGMVEMVYTTPKEMNNLLKSFVKGSFSAKAMTDFFFELSNIFSEFVFYTQSSLNEIKELEMLKSSLNIRYRSFNKLSMKQEKQIRDLTDRLDEMSHINSKFESFKKEKSSLENDLIALRCKANKAEASLAECQDLNKKYKLDYNMIYGEYMHFKRMITDEVRNLKYEVVEVKKENENLTKTLLDFKNFFGSLNVDTAGEVKDINKI